MPSSKPASKPAPSSPAPAPKKQSIVNKITQSVAPQKTPTQSQPKVTTPQKNITPSPTVQQAVPKPQVAKPQPPTARPSVKPPMTPKTVQNQPIHRLKFLFHLEEQKAGQYATGPISGSGSSIKAEPKEAEHILQILHLHL